MSKKISAILLIASLLSFALPQPTIAQDVPLKKIPLLQSKKSQPAFVEGEVIVKYKSTKKQKAALDKIRSLKDEKSLQVKDEIADLNLAMLKSDKKSTADLLSEMQKDTDVEYAEPNYTKQLAYTPNDSYFSTQWAHQNAGQTVDGIAGTADADIDSTQAWDIERSAASDTIIAVLDDGVEHANTELHANMWDGSTSCKSDTGATISCPNHGWDYADNDNDPNYNYHGTFVASVMAAVTNNNAGIAGMSRYGHNKIMAIRFGLDTFSEIQGIHFAKNNGAKVINASFVGDTFAQAEKDAIDAFPGIVVAASGNDSVDVGATPQYPCAYTSSNVICVGAST
ncbi:MAG: S8 family serine peptidase, partial [Parcubacteria group bacterium]